jgi:hypothetical protein
VNNPTIPSMHAERQITNLSDNTLSLYIPLLALTDGQNDGQGNKLILVGPSDEQNEMIIMGHQISSCHVPVVRSFFIL